MNATVRRTLGADIDASCGQLRKRVKEGESIADIRKTDRGRVRTDNQDAYFAGKITDDAVFAVVCDGMGGANAGNVASELAVRHISEYVIRSYRSGMNMTDTEKTLKNAIVSANISLYDKAVNNTELAGMGTTTVAAFVKDGTAVIAHVGDSRIYLVNGEIKQLTVTTR